MFFLNGSLQELADTDKRTAHTVIAEANGVLPGVP